MRVFSADDTNSLEQHVSIKLQQVQRNYRLRNLVDWRVTVVNC